MNKIFLKYLFLLVVFSQCKLYAQSDLKIHWTFDSVYSESMIPDDSGNTKNGTVKGKVESIDGGKLNKAIGLNAGCVVQEQTTSLSDNFTVSTYFYPTTLDFTNRVMIGKSNFGKGQSEWFIKIGTTNQLEVGIWNGSSWIPLVSKDKVLPNTWQHVAFIVENNIAKLYHNGVLAASADVSTRVKTEAMLTVGAMMNGDSGISFQFLGNLDDFRMYDVALNGTEISTLVGSVLQNSSRIKVACVGNSITENYAVPEADRYPTILQSLIGDTYEVRNYGLGGRTLLKKGDVPYWNEATYTSVKNWQPNIVIIKLGTNDSKQVNWQYKADFIQDYIDFINSFKNLPTKPSVYICKPIPVYYGNHNLRGDVIVNEIFPMLTQIAAETNTKIIDFYTPMEGKEYLLYDRIHPNAKGTTIMAHVAGQAICPECNVPDAVVEAPVGWFKSFPDTIEIQHADIVAVDVDDDDDLDIVTSGFHSSTLSLSSIYINDGTGKFTLQAENDVITPGDYADIKIGDINADGKIDAIFNGHKGKGIAYGDGAGKFVLANDFDLMNASNHTAACGFADFNNDGLLDYYVFGLRTDGNAIFFQNLNGTFTKDGSSFSQYSFIDPDISLLDFNNDGYVDIFLNTWEYNIINTRFSAIFLNDGTGKFTQMSQPDLISKGYGSASWGDVDGDGWLDLLLNGDGGADGESSNAVYRLYKNNNGIFEAKATFSNYRQISVGDGSRFIDWDNDGDLDIILTGWSATKNRQTTMLFECTDALNFTYVESSLSNTDFPGISESSIEIADINNDSRPDLLLSGYNGSSLYQIGGFNKNICGYYINYSSSTNTAPSTPSNLNVSINKETVMFSWEAATDDLTPIKALSYNMFLKNKTTGAILYNPLSNLTTGWRKVSGVMGNMYLNLNWTLNLHNGEYEWTVQAIDANFMGGSFAPTETFTVTNSTTNNMETQVSDFSVYTTENLLNIKFMTVPYETELNIYQMDGRIVYSNVIAKDFQKELLPGIYFVKLTNNGLSNTYKVIAK